MSDCFEADELNKVQSCQLSILKELKRICVDNAIPFYLTYGTCIGAVRHHGFIPWDDDIDIHMRIEDVERLKQIKDQLPPHLFFQTYETDPEYGLLIARIRDTNTTLIEQDHYDRDINHGVYIDIYPLFYISESKYGLIFMELEALLARLLTYNSPPMNKGKIVSCLARIVLMIIPSRVKKQIAMKLYHHLTSHSKTKYVSDVLSFDKRFHDEWFKDPMWSEFEGTLMPLPSNYDEFLTVQYGDYMQLPPIEQRKIHHHYLFIDLSSCYLKYKGMKYCVAKR